MDKNLVEDGAVQRFSWRLTEILERLAGSFCRVPKLDMETVPDRVKRDLGFLDGREPHYEDERRR